MNFSKRIYFEIYFHTNKNLCNGAYLTERNPMVDLFLDMYPKDGDWSDGGDDGPLRHPRRVREPSHHQEAVGGVGVRDQLGDLGGDGRKDLN